MRYWAVIIFLFSYTEVLAVSISEVAWMGDTVSANHEWIELFNEGAATSVEGWTLSDGMNLSITLAGDLAAGEYAVLERTSEDSSGAQAFLIYTGSLINTGATLVLKDANGQVVDQVSGGENWKNIGGDNVTKETAQYSGQGWVTDVPTPGLINGGGRVENIDTDNTQSTSSTNNTKTTKKSSATTPLPVVSPTLKFTTEHQAVAYVGQPVRFSSKSTASQSTKNLLQYHWNFGDTHATSGLVVSHTYNHPGVYVVTTYVKRANDEHIVRSEITVVPVSISISFGYSGVVYIHNNAPYDIDVSGYVVKATKSTKFPPRSIIKTGGTITLAYDELGSWANGVVVKDSAGVIAASKYIDDDNDSDIVLSYQNQAANPSFEVVSIMTTNAIGTTTTELVTTDVAEGTPNVIYIEPENNAAQSTHNRLGYVAVFVIGLALLFSTYLRHQNRKAT
jgi:PKD domain/Lamin Tail Domain